MLSLRSKKREAGWMAVLPKHDRIDLAHVLQDGRARPEIRMLESFRNDADAVASLLRLRSAKHLERYACTTLLSAGQYHLAQLEAPPVPVEERADALRWRFKDMVDFPVEGASIGVLDIPLEGASGSRQPMVYAVAAGAVTVGTLMQTYAAAKLSLDAIDIPELAQRNVAALFEADNRGLAFLHLDESGGLLTVTYRGELYAARKIEISAAQLADADSERRASLLERVMLELQRTLDNFDRQYSFISVAGLLVAACPEVPELQSYLADNLYVPVQMMDLAQVCDFPAVPELRDVARQAQCLQVIGAALRTPGTA